MKINENHRKPPQRSKGKHLCLHYKEMIHLMGNYTNIYSFFAIFIVKLLVKLHAKPIKVAFCIDHLNLPSLLTVSSHRSDYNPVHSLHGWGGAARWPDRHHLPGKAVLLWISSLPQIPPWIRLLPHCRQKRRIKHQHSQHYQHQHQHQHQHEQAAPPQGLHWLIFLIIGINFPEKLGLIAKISHVFLLSLCTTNNTHFIV